MLSKMLNQFMDSCPSELHGLVISFLGDRLYDQVVIWDIVLQTAIERATVKRCVLLLKLLLNDDNSNDNDDNYDNNDIRCPYSLYPCLIQTVCKYVDSSEAPRLLIRFKGIPFFERIAFSEACKNGRLDLLKELDKCFGNFQVPFHGYAKDFLLYHACKKGYLDMVQWLLSRFGVKESDYKTLFCNSEEGPVQSLLTLAYQSGNLALVQWLDGHLPLSQLTEDYKTDLFCRVCYCGHLAIARWMYTKVVIRRCDLDHYFFRSAAQSGNLELVQWIWSTFIKGKAINDGDDDDFFIGVLSQASERGHLDLVRWMCENFLREIPLPMQGDAFVDHILSCDQAAVAWYLICTFGISDRLTLRRCFQVACQTNELAVAKQVASRLPPVLDAKEILFNLEQPRQKENLEMVQWLVSLYHHYSHNSNNSNADADEDKDYKHCLEDAFNWACIRGHLSLAKLLKGRLRKDTFRSVCGSGHVLVAHWLYLSFSIDKEQLEEAFSEVCLRNNWVLAPWLDKICGNSSTPELKLNNYVMALGTGNLDMARWYIKRFPYQTMQFSLESLLETLDTCYFSGNFPLIKFLVCQCSHLHYFASSRVSKFMDNAIEELRATGYLEMAQWLEKKKNHSC